MENRAIDTQPAVANSAAPLGIGARIAILVAICIADKILLDQFVDFDPARSAQGFGALIRTAQHWGFRFLAVFAAALIVFTYVRGGEPLERAAAGIKSAALRARWLVLHAALLAALVPLTYSLFHRVSGPFSTQWAAALWILAAAGALLAAALCFAPARLWRAMARALGPVWLYAFLAALVGSAAIQLSQLLWAPTAGITFSAVSFLLRGWMPGLIADPATRLLSTDRFAVLVADECSGLEGVGLILAFLACWLTAFRHEYRFPRALWLIPLGLGAIFALNILRIAALMLIGDAGHADVAIYGFHSQAGWMSFIAVACGIAYWSRSSAWLNRRPPAAAAIDAAGANFTAVYLLPFLAILAAGLVSHALSGRFETFYPLRLIASLWVLWMLRRHWRDIEWRASWRAPAVGIAVFVLWWAAARWLLADAPPPAALSVMPASGRWSWIAGRALAAITTVPLAEELAYRGYLMRRLQAEEFQRLPYGAVRWPAVLISSAAFGAMHGSMWLPAAAAGVAYALLARRQSSLGEAVLAHATTNALAAAAVLTLGDWRLW